MRKKAGPFDPLGSKLLTEEQWIGTLSEDDKQLLARIVLAGWKVKLMTAFRDPTEQFWVFTPPALAGTPPGLNTVSASPNEVSPLNGGNVYRYVLRNAIRHVWRNRMEP